MTARYKNKDGTTEFVAADHGGVPRWSVTVDASGLQTENWEQLRLDV